MTDPIYIAVADSYNPLQPFKQPHIDITLDIARQIVALAGIPALEGERINAVERRIAALEAFMKRDQDAVAAAVRDIEASLQEEPALMSTATPAPASGSRLIVTDHPDAYKTVPNPAPASGGDEAASVDQPSAVEEAVQWLQTIDQGDDDHQMLFLIRDHISALRADRDALAKRLAEAVGGIRRVTTQSRNGVTKCTVVGPDTLADLDALLAEIGGGT